ncbi:MAG: DUF885 family protein [Planctomycetes bacterium]|nr:DUF885 family protein [Planctomycetota bacterium]
MSFRLLRAARGSALLLVLPCAALAQERELLRDHIARYEADRGALRRRYELPLSARYGERMRAFHAELIAALDALPFEDLPPSEQLDWLLLRRHVQNAEAERVRDALVDEELRSLLPFAAEVLALEERRREFEPLNPERAAEACVRIAEVAAGVQRELDGGKHAGTAPKLGARAAERSGELRRALRQWFRFYDGYDPLFTWWVAKPYEAADQALEKHERAVRAKLVDVAGDASLIGDPIGEAALRVALDHELIPYSSAELVAIAEREFAWCDAEMEKAASELGYPGEWRKAQEAVKRLHVAPGEQPRMIRDLAREAIAFVKERDLLTIPPLAEETWRMSMMSPEAQRTNPYFLGGEVIQVSFPTASMTHAEKLQSLRSNNEHQARATVHHELIPGHHLQQFMTARHRPWRQLFDTPFWVEGWALYWEFRLWELGLAKSPADRIGFLFWRKHRCARIVFSLAFHSGKWNARQCVEYLVERVGHEPAAAEAEVRRSVAGAYGPLYQAAYMLGGLQIRSLHRELVERGGWSEKRFHDAVLRENAIPIALLRATLRGDALTRDFDPRWRFAD